MRKTLDEEKKLGLDWGGKEGIKDVAYGRGTMEKASLLCKHVET